MIATLKKIDYIKESKILEITMDSCQWAQEWYEENKPENVWMKLTLHGIDEYNSFFG